MNVSTWVDRAAALTVVATGAAAALVLLFWWLDWTGEGVDDPVPAGLGEAEFATLVSTGQRLGSVQAPVRLLLYHDYRCGFCRQLHRRLEELRGRYPQHLAVIYKHFVNRSSPAGMDYLVPLGAECAAEQGAFERYHQSAYENGQTLEDASGPWRIAEAAGVPDSAAFSACVISRRYAERIRREYAEARALGATVTPTMFLNGRPIVGAANIATLDSLIAAELPRRLTFD